MLFSVCFHSQDRYAFFLKKARFVAGRPSYNFIQFMLRPPTLLALNTDSSAHSTKLLIQTNAGLIRELSLE
jgi:hypothetical protein